MPLGFLGGVFGASGAGQIQATRAAQAQGVGSPAAAGGLTGSSGTSQWQYYNPYRQFGFPDTYQAAVQSQLMPQQRPAPNYDWIYTICSIPGIKEITVSPEKYKDMCIFYGWNDASNYIVFPHLNGTLNIRKEGTNQFDFDKYLEVVDEHAP